MLWAIIQLCGVGVMVLTRFAYRPLLRRSSHLLVGQCILRWPVLLGMVILPLLASLPGWPHRFSLALSPLAGPVGCLMLAYACWLFWRSQHDVLLGNAQRKPWPGGVYQRIRHPLYAALWLAALAQFLLVQDGLAGSGGVLALLFSYGRSVRREEGLLLQWLGDAYRQYMQHTGRLWPRGLAR